MAALRGPSSASLEVKNSSGDVIAQELIALFEKCKVPPALRTILTDKDFIDVHDITLLGESEKEVVESVKGCAGLPTTPHNLLTILALYARQQPQSKSEANQRERERETESERRR